MVAEIHDRMPLILAPVDCMRWLSDEPDPHDLMRPCPAEPMLMWPISTRVNKPENDDDDPSILEPIEVAMCVWRRQLKFTGGICRYSDVLFLRTSHSIWQTTKS